MYTHVDHKSKHVHFHESITAVSCRLQHNQLHQIDIPAVALGGATNLEMLLQMLSYFHIRYRSLDGRPCLHQPHLSIEDKMEWVLLIKEVSWHGEQALLRLLSDITPVSQVFLIGVCQPEHLQDTIRS